MSPGFAGRGCHEYQLLQRLERRQLLRVGSLGLLGLSLPQLLASESRASSAAATRPPARARSCILVFLSGGASQYETFDPKPEAPSEIRSLFGTVRTAVPGMFLSEHLERLAPLARHFALVRSVYHKYGGHFGGHRYALTGHISPGSPDQPAREDDHPGLIGLAARDLTGRHGFPPTVMLPWPATDQGNSVSGGMGGGVLGKEYNPLLVEASRPLVEAPKDTPAVLGNEPSFRVPALSLPAGVTAERLVRRRGLLGRLDREQELTAEPCQEMASHYERACELLLSPQVKEGFEIDREPPPVRDRYGLNAFGQSCLLARRLVERGTRFVQVNFSRTVTQKGYGWDTHNKGLETMRDYLLPRLNAGLASLLEELRERGLLEETLVLVMGEFGRTPRLKKDGGRDHWPQCYSLLAAGGGVHGGLIHGRSDSKGAYPAEDAVEARDVLLTVLTLLGMSEVHTDVQGRTAALWDGARPIEKLYR